MLVTLVGIALLAFAGSYEMLLVAAAVVGVGSATFHPEASRVADGLRRALRHRAIAFQVGGNTGSALGPLLTAAIVIPHGQPAIAWFMLAAALAILVLLRVTGWSVRHGQARLKTFASQQAPGCRATPCGARWW
jgi:FSR family fosmidomycin resistance protein-like MFS transporter